MPENEFEKKVSSEMQGLKFKPSQNVWLRVEERIRKKNKRRVFVIIFLLAGLALLGYWQRNNLFGEKGTSIVTTEKQNEVNPKPLEETNNSSTTKQSTDVTKQEEIKNTSDKDVNNKSAITRSVIDKKDVVVSKKEIDRPKVINKNETKVKPASEKTKIEQKQKVSTDAAIANSQKQNPVIKDAKAKDTLVVETNPETIIRPDDVKQPAVKPVENLIDSLKADVHVQEKIATEKTDTLLKLSLGKNRLRQ